VTFLDSSGIRVLLLGRDLAADHAVTFRVVDPRPVVRRVLDLAGVLDLLTNGS
jgi:anti-anti-sigma factor